MLFTTTANCCRCPFHQRWRTAAAAHSRYESVRDVSWEREKRRIHTHSPPFPSFFFYMGKHFLVLLLPPCIFDSAAAASTSSSFVPMRLVVSLSLCMQHALGNKAKTDGRTALWRVICRRYVVPRPPPPATDSMQIHRQLVDCYTYTYLPAYLLECLNEWIL